MFVIYILFQIAFYPWQLSNIPWQLDYNFAIIIAQTQSPPACPLSLSQAPASLQTYLKARFGIEASHSRPFRYSITLPTAVPRHMPLQQLDESINDVAFDKHTYKHTTMGFFKDIVDMPNQYEYSLKFYKIILFYVK